MQLQLLETCQQQRSMIYPRDLGDAIPKQDPDS